MTVTLNLLPIPNGINPQGMLSLSIVVAPRLADSRRLGAYPDMLNWTQRLADAPPRIVLQLGAVTVEAEAITDQLRPDLWSALFREDTPVDPFQFDDASGRLVNSYRTREALAIVKGGYQRVIAASPGQLPEAAFTGRLLSGLTIMEPDEDIDRILAGHRRHRYRYQQDSRGHDNRGDQSARETLADFSLYHRMPQPDERAPDPIPRTPEALSETIDFHKALTALSAHPSLMRALGLIIDVVAPAGEVQAAGTLGMGLAVATVVGLETASGFEDVTLMTPRVRYRYHPAGVSGAGVFAAASQREDTIAEGFLGLSGDLFQLIDLDIDGALAKLMSLAAMLPRASGSPTADGALPALRSAGFSLAAHDRGNEVVRALHRAAELNKGLETQPGGNGPPLEAEDLVKGYRLDVWSASSGRWDSLHRRRATYRFGEQGDIGLEVEEEGFSQFAAASPAPDPLRVEDPSLPPVESDLYVHEALARWTGWSLSVPRPGQPIHRSDPHDPLKPDDTADALVTAFAMRQSFAPVPRSLPRLRFGDRYRIRARIVDVAGNSPPPSAVDAGPVASSSYPVALPQTPEAQPYFRYEPVSHPILVLRQMPEERRPALDRVVIRSFNSDPTLDGVVSSDAEERHIAPPRISVDMAERHGLLDDVAGRLKGDPATFAMLVGRDDAAFNTVSIGDPPTETPLEGAAQLVVDYLPDPMSRAAAFRHLPGVSSGQVLFAGAGGIVTEVDDPIGEAGPVLKVGFGEGWPARQAFRIVVVEGTDAPKWEAGGRILTISLPKALTAEVRLSSAFSDSDLELMGVWAWQRDFLDEVAQQVIAGAGDPLADWLELHARLAALLSRLAREGGQWSLSPSIPLHLIHAVQQPIGRPAFICPSLPASLRGSSLLSGRRTLATAALIAVRSPGAPDATLLGNVRTHLASTGQIELRARWRDIAEAPEKPDGVDFTDSSAMVEVIRLDRPEGEVPAQGADARSVAIIRPPDMVSFAPERYEGGVRPSAAPIQRFGDTKHRWVRYEAIATSRFITDFPADENLVFTRSSEAVEVSVPNSARPPTPKIVQILPTFGWRREQSGTLTSSVRFGRGLRVYLDRPWFASGEGELLGVVLWQTGRSAPNAAERRDRYAGFVTEWGLDPARRSGRLKLMPDLADLTDATVTMAEVGLPEAETNFDIAGHPVHFDRARGLWYADITLAAEYAYMPFVRLALVRFQPDSIRGAEISGVAPAEFIQIAPDRSAVLIADPIMPRLYRLVVAGRAPTPGTEMRWRNRIEVSIQERRKDLVSDLGWQPASSVVAKVTPIAATTDAPSVLFSGLVEFASAPASGQYRLVIREYERWQIDEPEPIYEVPFGVGMLEVAGSNAFTVMQGVERASQRLRAAAMVSHAETPDRAFAVSARAIERLGWAIVGPRTGTRLVYAEFIGIEPSAIPRDPSALPGGEGGGTPGGGVPGEPTPDPDETPPWMSYAGPQTGFQPRWDEAPDIEAGAPIGAVKLAQSMLNATGIPGVALIVDGVFGPVTEAAIRAFRLSNQLADAGGLDATSWIRLALAAPFPVLEPGIGNPPMAGPPIALVQRLLNIEATAPLPEDGIYTPATAARVSAFQSGRALTPTGIVDPATWLELADLFQLVEPLGMERIALEFDRARLVAGDPPIQLLERQAVEGALPVSDPIDEDWSNRAGVWLEIRDVTGRPLFRHIFGQSMTRGHEIEAGDGDPMGSPGTAPDLITYTTIVPILAAARSLAVFGTLDPDNATPAAPVTIFDPW